MIKPGSKFFSSDLSGNAGQALLEAVLVIALFSVFTATVIRGLEEIDFVGQLVSDPVEFQLKGMVENGAWGSGEGSRFFHPNSIARHQTLQGTILEE